MQSKKVRIICAVITMSITVLFAVSSPLVFCILIFRQALNSSHVFESVSLVIYLVCGVSIFVIAGGILTYSVLYHFKERTEKRWYKTVFSILFFLESLLILSFPWCQFIAHKSQDTWNMIYDAITSIAPWVPQEILVSDALQFLLFVNVSLLMLYFISFCIDALIMNHGSKQT